MKGIQLNENWVFKYGDLDHIEDTLLLNTLGFSKVSKLNDPFELAHRFYYNRIDKNLDYKDNKNYDGFTKEKREILNNLKISCFSRTYSEPLMWGHYANKHNGVCYCFDEVELAAFGLSAHFADIIYSNQLPTIYYDEDITLPIRWKTELFRIIMTKSLHWNYEKEFRIILKDGAENKYREQSLKAIILGYRASIWHKKRILEIVEKANQIRKQKIEVYYACLSTENYEIIIDNKPSGSLSENSTIIT